MTNARNLWQIPGNQSQAIILVAQYQLLQILINDKLSPWDRWFNPILTGLFESKFLLGGGLGGQFDPPFRSRPKGADRCEILHGCQHTCKEYCYNLFLGGKQVFIYYVIMIYRNFLLRYAPDCTFSSRKMKKLPTTGGGGGGGDSTPSPRSVATLPWTWSLRSHRKDCAPPKKNVLAHYATAGNQSQAIILVAQYQLLQILINDKLHEMEPRRQMI